MTPKFTTQEVEVAAARMASRRSKVGREIFLALSRAGAKIVTIMRQEPFQSGRLTVRSGALRRGFNSKVEEGGSKLSLKVFNTEKYAGIQEYGGVITPKSAKMLAIPLAGARTASGVNRYPGGPRSLTDLVLIQRRGRNALLVRFQNKRVKHTYGPGSLVKGPASRREMIPMFALVPSVKLRPRMGFREQFAKAVLEPRGPVKQELISAVQRIMKNG